MKVQPLIKIFEELFGEQNACYYFGRVKESDAVYISHHFEKRPDIREVFPEAIKILNEITNEVKKAKDKKK